MGIEYGTPFLKAWERMKTALFRPFDIGKWFVLGFSAFLAYLLNNGGRWGNFPGFPGNNRKIKTPDIEQIPGQVSEWIHLHIIAAIFIVIGILVGIGVVLVLTWLSSRGGFIFLDNVVYDRARIVKPWGKYRILGNSLFFWRIGYAVVSSVIVLPLLAITLILVIRYSRGPFNPSSVIAFISLGFIWLIITLAAAYISLFTNSFVVPVMYKHELRIIPAWQKFLLILKSHFGHFLLYGLFIFVLTIGITIAAILAGCLTCCIGYLLLGLPYISSVILLPVSFTLRAFSLEYLAQWGEDYSVFPGESLPPDDVPPPPPDDVPPPPPGVKIIGM